MTFDQYWRRLGRADIDSPEYRLAREAWQEADLCAREACAEICRRIAHHASEVIRHGIDLDRRPPKK